VNRLAIVIVSYNARDDLARTLESLTSAAPAVSHEIVVVDNASTDGAPDLVLSRFPRVRLIPAGGNLGFAKANNVGIRSTTSELLLLLNPDTIVPPGAIDRLVACLEGAPDVAIVGPRIVDDQGRPELSIGGPVNPWREAGRKAVQWLDTRGHAVARRWIDRHVSQERDVEWVTGACLLARRADAEAVGLLDERYFLYMEDVDFCTAVKARGRRVVFTPAAEVVHRRGRSGANDRGRVMSAWHRSHLAFYRKNLPLWAPLLALYQRWTGAGEGRPDADGKRT
jgi:GT2 family glycosyltransferase